MNRSDFLKLIGAGIALWYAKPLIGAIPEQEFTKYLFGDSFEWGVATSAFQTEGAWNIDGKGESIWDRFAHTKGKIKDGSNADIASDFYHQYPDDLKLLQNLNFKNFRFSISWSRILPMGTGAINNDGIDFYNRVIDSCIELGIEPWICLYHWDLPQTLEDQGGWTNRSIVQWFSEFVEVCSKKFGDRVKNWLVINEPVAFTTLGYFIGMHAPGRIGINSYLSSIHHAALCQAEGGRIIRKNVGNSRIGTALSCAFIEPQKAKPRHQRAAKRLDVIINRLFIEPALGMGYPVEDLPFLRKLGKFTKPGDDEKLKFDFDFVGLQNYYRIVTKPGIVPFVWANQMKPGENAELTDMGWEVSPEGIYKILKQFAKYPIKEIIITENGASFPDTISNGHIADVQRIKFFKDYLGNILKAKNEGVKISGYFVWTFIDNFEWKEGFRPKFGIVSNDFNTQKRIVKDSGFWFKKFLEQNYY